MPRKPGVYRNIKMSKVTALVLDVKTEQTREEVYVIPFTGDKDKALKLLEKKYNTKNFRVIRIKKLVDSVESYYMSIDNFIKYADLIEERK